MYLCQQVQLVGVGSPPLPYGFQDPLVSSPPEPHCMICHPSSPTLFWEWSFLRQVLLCIPGWPGTHDVDQADLKLVLSLFALLNKRASEMHDHVQVVKMFVFFLESILCV